MVSLSVLIDFRVENYRSFASEQEFTMVASNDDTRAPTLIDCGKFKLLKTAAVYGANASGKSNLLKAITVFRILVLNSATELTLGDPIPGMVPFRLDKDWTTKPSKFEITVLVNGSRYEYGFSATSERVHSEWLFVRGPGLNSRLSKRFSREFNVASGETDWDIRGLNKNDEKFLREKTRDNGLLLSRAANMNFELVSELFLWLKRNLWNLDLSGSLEILQDVVAQRIYKDQNLGERVLLMLRDADTGISGISVVERPFSDREGMSVDLMRALETLHKHIGEEGTQPLTVLTTHYDTDHGNVTFSMDGDESVGTQRYFAIVSLVLVALATGATIIVDELECSMHPLLTRKLVELFYDPNENPKGAQLIFATHDTSLMDASLFRRDQVWIAEKNQSGATELFSLYDFNEGAKPRKEEAIRKNYLAGRYGGIPNFGPIFEDLEIQ